LKSEHFELTYQPFFDIFLSTDHGRGDCAMASLNTYFIAGHARLPQGMAAKSIFDSLTITVEVDKKYGVIVDASCTLATEHGRDFVGRILKGFCLQDGVDELIGHLQVHYRGKAANALAAALKDLHQQYEQLHVAKAK
jgi:hypothetical protein